MKKEYDIAISYATAQKDLADRIYHYVKSAGWRVFFAPACQSTLAGANQREVFFRIFSQAAEFVVLLVSQDYLTRKVPMEEANIAITAHRGDGHVIPVYLDDARLPDAMWNPDELNYFSSSNPAEIASLLNDKLTCFSKEERLGRELEASAKAAIYIQGNSARNMQIFTDPVINGSNRNG